MDFRFIRFFKPFRHLNDEQVQMLGKHLKFSKFKANQVILEKDSESLYQYFLLKGDVELSDKQGKRWVVKARSENARGPLSPFRPSRYEITSVTPIQLMRIKLDVILQYIQKKSPKIIKDDTSQHPVYRKFIEDLKQDKLALPSMPDIAIKIREAINDEHTDYHDIANIIVTDPAITAKIIKTANSPLYFSVNKIENCSMAVSRLGTTVTAQLVQSYSMQELFKAKNPALKLKMQQVWDHSRYVAALSYVLAKITPGFAPEKALLAGLLHDIGTIPILSYADQYPQLMEDEIRFNELIDSLKGEIGATTLSKWKFGSELITTARECEDWMRQPGEKPDYCDVILIAQLHSFIGSDKVHSVPALDQVPAFSKLVLGKLSPSMSLMILEDAKDQVNETLNLLS